MLYQWGRKDGFPGADGSTIQANGNATTIPIYSADGGILTEGSETGLQKVDITTSGVLNGNASQVYAIKNPLIYIGGVSSLYDWYTNSETYQDNTLWGDGKEKSAYDPCPKRWRVLTDGTYGDFSTTTMVASGSGTNVANGRTYNNMAWFPAAGYRSSGSGALNYLGNRGYYWSASATDTQAKRFFFYMSGVNPSSPYHRAIGFSVRCVQE